jgi:hypothetical protein
MRVIDGLKLKVEELKNLEKCAKKICLEEMARL